MALPLLVAAAVIGLDQATKWLIVQWLGPDRAEHRWGVLEPAFALQYVENTGAAFGLMRGRGLLLILLAVVVVGGVVISYRHLVVPSPRAAICLGLLLGGAGGNLIDRVRLGYVVDFIAVGPWPKFNVADSAVTIGALVLAWHFIFGGGRPQTEDGHNPRPSTGVSPKAET